MVMIRWCSSALKSWSTHGTPIPSPDQSYPLIASRPSTMTILTLLPGVIDQTLFTPATWVTGSDRPSSHLPQTLFHPQVPSTCTRKHRRGRSHSTRSNADTTPAVHYHDEPMSKSQELNATLTSCTLVHCDVARQPLTSARISSFPPLTLLVLPLCATRPSPETLTTRRLHEHLPSKSTATFFLPLNRMPAPCTAHGSPDIRQTEDYYSVRPAPK